jgi:hypothetical protein
LKTIISSLLSVVTLCVAFSQNAKYERWMNPSGFRGFNVLAIVKNSQEDFNDLKLAGATIAFLNVRGFYKKDPPYARDPEIIAEIDSATARCRAAGLSYALTVRTGPGREDVWKESDAGYPKSTIWKNENEQYLYASMIKEMVDRYSPDPLCVGISPILEPNPLFDYIYSTPGYLSSLLIEKGIDLRKINEIMIDSIRAADPEIPVLIQNIAYSAAEFWSEFYPYDDPYAVYEFHSYRPLGYASERTPMTKKYPGSYLSVNDQTFKHCDREFLSDNAYRAVSAVEKRTRRPVFLGEFGLCKEQYGGTKNLRDIMEICLEKGRHFALWVYRSGSSDGSWDYEAKSPEYWELIREMFARNSEYEAPEETELNIYPSVTSGDISIELAGIEAGELKIYDSFGREIANLSDRLQSNFFNGISVIDYNCRSFAVGAYFVQASSGGKKLDKAFLVVE